GRESSSRALRPQAGMGEEMVVVGYGTQEESEITGSVGSIEMNENLESAPVSDFGSIMHGKVAGVQIQSASGQPGQSSTIKIRGVKSLSAGDMPLLVIEGEEMRGYSVGIM